MSFLQDSAAKVEAWIAERERSGADWADPRRETPQGVLKAPKFVKFHMLDSGEGCDEIFWEGGTCVAWSTDSFTDLYCVDPLTFTPRRGRNGWIDSWGIYPVRVSDIYALTSFVIRSHCG